MNLKIYQTFFRESQFGSLEKEFIPYNNLENKTPDFREYPMMLDLYSKNQHYNGHWGLVSWKFKQKTNLSGEQCIQLIKENPGYDVYHFNPYGWISKTHINSFIQGECYNHPGIIDYTNNLMSILGYDNFDIRNVQFNQEEYSYCLYYIGNQYFWDHWMTFLTTCVQVSEKHPKLKQYLYGFTSTHDEKPNIQNFPFVVERLVSILFYLNKTIKVKCFTIG